MILTVQLSAPVRAQTTRNKTPESRRRWVVQGHGLVMLCLFFFLSFLIEFEVVVFCFLKKWKRMKLRKYNDINSEKPPAILTLLLEK